MADLEKLYEELLAGSNGTPTGAMLQSDINRGVLPGRKTQAANLPVKDLAELDRYAWGKQAGLGGLPVAAGYEAIKGINAGKWLPMVAKMMGFEDTGNQFQQDKTSSPASWSNLAAYIKGARSRGR